MTSQVAVSVFKNPKKEDYLCGGDPDYILKLVAYLDSKMRTLADENQTVDSACLGVLAALNIANEYHLLKTKLRVKRRKRAKRCA